MKDRLVLIIGAGPTGLVLALWLTRLGVRVRIIDKTAAPGTTSRAVAVQARTLELYRQVDLSGAVVADGVKVAAANLWVGGARAARLPPCSSLGAGDGLLLLAASRAGVTQITPFGWASVPGDASSWCEGNTAQDLQVTC